MADLLIDYNEQMLNYYPEVIKAIREFQALISTQSLQVEEMHDKLTKLLEDSYVITADESRIEQWEKVLGIVPLPQGDDTLETWLSDRRETILARLYQTPKLNTKSISDIVKIFTGGDAKSYFKDGIIYIVITPPKQSKQYKFQNVEQELSKKIPAHLMYQVDRNYYTWLQVNATHPTWEDVNNEMENWESVLLNSTYGESSAVSYNTLYTGGVVDESTLFSNGTVSSKTLFIS